MIFKKHYYLGQAANYSCGDVFGHLFSVGLPHDYGDLAEHLVDHYKGERAFLCKNGRSALCLALKAYFEKNDLILVNGFTCYAVYEAVVSAGLKPLFVDINRSDLNFDEEALKKAVNKKVKGIIIQNSLGNPVDIKKIKEFAKEHDLIIIEDLAHSVGVKYKDGRECGTVGAACALSFGKDKSIDTISGGAVVFRKPVLHEVKAPWKAPRLSDHLRAKFYPLFGAISRGLSHVHLGGILMRGLVKIHWVEKSADNRLDLERRISWFEAKLALRQFGQLKRSGETPIREFDFVEDRDRVLEELAEAGYYFDGLWYKQPVSPERYYKKVHFPEADCPNSVFVADHIVNFPTYYARSDLKKARDIVKKHAIKEGNG